MIISHLKNLFRFLQYIYQRVEAIGRSKLRLYSIFTLLILCSKLRGDSFANDNWMEFTIRYVVDYKRRRGTRDMVFTRIPDEFEKTESKVVIVSLTVQYVKTSVFDVRVMNDQKGS